MPIKSNISHISIINLFRLPLHNMLGEARFPVIGTSGVGKSTFLNYIFQSDQDAIKTKLFKSGQGSKSVTTDIKNHKGYVYGTQFEMEAVDVPGGFSIDNPLGDWVNMIKTIPKFTEILWVVDITKRISQLESMLLESFPLMFDKYKPENVIIVFTHCDQLDDDTPEEAAKQWFQNLNRNLKKEFPYDMKNVVFFGKKNGPKYDNTKYRAQFAQLANAHYQNGLSTSVNQNIDPNEVALNGIKNGSQSLAAVLKEKAEEERKLREQISLNNRLTQNHTIFVQSAGGGSACTFLQIDGQYYGSFGRGLNMVYLNKAYGFSGRRYCTANTNLFEVSDNANVTIQNFLKDFRDDDLLIMLVHDDFIRNIYPYTRDMIASYGSTNVYYVRENSPWIFIIDKQKQFHYENTIRSGYINTTISLNYYTRSKNQTSVKPECNIF